MGALLKPQMMTKEERIIYDKEYRAKNRESILAKKKAYYESNKEKIAAYNLANKEKMQSYNKAYREANKEEEAARHKTYRERLKEGHYSVYYLPEEHYIGVTSGVKIRMLNHDSDGMLTDGYEVVFTSTDKKEAYAFERKLHSMGYNGSVKDGYLAKRREYTKSLKERLLAA